MTTHTYTYDTDYPRLVGEDVGDGSASDRTRDIVYDARNLFVESDEWTQDGITLAHTFGDHDAFGRSEFRGEEPGRGARKKDALSRAQDGRLGRKTRLKTPGRRFSANC